MFIKVGIDFFILSLYIRVYVESSDRGVFFDMTGWDPSVCKSNRLHVDILRFSFIKLGYIS